MESLAAEVRADAEELQATFFEVITAVSLLRFARAEALTAVLEVGMGGRLDATNVADPRLCVITGVALDHTAILGGTVPEIAAAGAHTFVASSAIFGEPRTRGHYAAVVAAMKSAVDAVRG